MNGQGYGQGGMATKAAQATPQAPPQVHTALEELDRQANSLLVHLGTLENRLVPILRPSQPEATIGSSGQKQGPSTVIPPLVEAMGNVHSLLLKAEQVIREITDRVEV